MWYLPKKALDVITSPQQFRFMAGTPTMSCYTHFAGSALAQEAIKLHTAELRGQSEASLFYHHFFLPKRVAETRQGCGRTEYCLPRLTAPATQILFCQDSEGCLNKRDQPLLTPFPEEGLSTLSLWWMDDHMLQKLLLSSRKLVKICFSTWKQPDTRNFCRVPQSSRAVWCLHCIVNGFLWSCTKCKCWRIHLPWINVLRCQ